MIQAKKRFGQNFLINEHTIKQIVCSLQTSLSDNVIEIGPGHAALSRLIQPLVKQLHLIEIDTSLIPKLNNIFAEHNNTTVHNLDALNLNPHDFLDPNPTNNTNAKIKIIGNLPYNVATQIICNLMQYNNVIDSMIFMVQKEVADRITAIPNNKHYGRLTIAIQYFCKAIHMFDVPATDFNPQPKVISSMICLTPYDTLPFVANNYEKLKEIVTVAFNQRRKTIGNSLKKYFSHEQLQSCGIAPTIRPEQVSIERFVELANHL